MADRTQARGDSQPHAHHQQHHQAHLAEGITFRAVGIPALAAILASSRGACAASKPAGQHSAFQSRHLDADADDAVALRSGN